MCQGNTGCTRDLTPAHPPLELYVWLNGVRYKLDLSSFYTSKVHTLLLQRYELNVNAFSGIIVSLYTVQSIHVRPIGEFESCFGNIVEIRRGLRGFTCSLLLTGSDATFAGSSDRGCSVI